MPKKGSLLSDSPIIWKIEKQVDAAHQHIRIALRLIRQEIKKRQALKSLDDF